MKRAGNIYPQIYDLENLRSAHKHARKDKAYYKEVQMVNGDEDFYLKQIQEMLIAKTYDVSEYEHKIIADSGKVRELMKLPYFPDRIIQWAIMLQIEKVFSQVFTDFTCASLKGRGIHRATQLLDRYMTDVPNTQYCLKLDISKFYPSIDHEILKSLLQRKFKDPDLLDLLFKIIDSMPNGKGVPIGSYLSQYLANFYLAYFDHWLKEKQGVKYVIRYMDDVVILSDSKEFLHSLKRKMDVYLQSELRLKIKDNWQVFPTNTRGIDFVGYRHFYEFKLLRKTSCKRFKRKMLSIRKKVMQNKPVNYTDWCSTNSYKGWLKWCDSFRLSQKYITPIQAAVDAYYLRNIRKAARA